MNIQESASPVARCLLSSLALLVSASALAQEPAAAVDQGEWHYFGNSVHGTRYSPLSQITPDNVRELKEVWSYHTGPEPEDAPMRGGLEVTPLMADNTVYVCNAYNAISAIDPETGKRLWRHDPQVNTTGVTHPVCRGVSYYKVPEPVPEQNCATRILEATVDNRLLAVDARTGERCTGFGKNGEVNLLEGMGEVQPGYGYPTSPPVIVNGVAVVGGFVIDNQSTDEPPGVIRGYDAVTGKFLWAWDIGRPGHTDEPADGQNYVRSTPNAWSVFSGDEQLGLIYIPTGNGTPDFFGGNRSPETEKYSSSVVAIDSRTGEVRWHFQTVHHDLWDYDVAAQPVLADIPTDHGVVPGLIQATKSAQVFVLDRRTGEPITAVEERPVPQSSIPGERTSPTQPFSVGMPSFAGPELTEEDMWGTTVFDQLYCRIKFREARYDGPFTPPGLDASIRYPGELGGIDWGGVSVNEDTGVMIVNSNRMADYDQMITREEADRLGVKQPKDPRTLKPGEKVQKAGEGAPAAPMDGTPFAITWGPFLTQLHVPCQQPPYGFLTAVDLKTKKVLWNRTIGTARDSGPLGIKSMLPIELGTPNIGGTVTTKSGLVFIAATQDQYLRAFDMKNGEELWKARLPAGGHATPMTYISPKSGRQFVLIAAGGNLSMGTTPGDSIVAYALPE